MQRPYALVSGRPCHRLSPLQGAECGHDAPARNAVEQDHGRPPRAALGPVSQPAVGRPAARRRDRDSVPDVRGDWRSHEDRGAFQSVGSARRLSLSSSVSPDRLSICCLPRWTLKPYYAHTETCPPEDVAMRGPMSTQSTVRGRFLVDESRPPHPQLDVEMALGAAESVGLLIRYHPVGFGSPGKQAGWYHIHCARRCHETLRIDGMKLDNITKKQFFLWIGTVRA